ncbi:PREDICTED: keratin, type II cytoskeletal 2 epidermal [Ceratosolen solmsi marchali]|uniref:Keratin, type II cytoskeletal 2 epidermal n=1 Tax=Ceratosolen solmsi marchali TaxID=326594 RepID=A0AAJ6YBX4_9HYME|nr:PREDICTED: keratin, type II cytoskeletal 2 epidermal [Ceratosolen solmsi marchali]
MKSLLSVCVILLAVGTTNCGPIGKNEALEELSPLNEVYVIQNDDEDRSDRDKRKIGIVKLGVSNGIINFVFGKLDAFLDAKTKALTILDEGNRAKNVAFNIDGSRSATSEFIGKYIAAKLKGSTGSVGPLLNAGTTFLSSAKQGIAGAFASKFAPLSALSGGLSGGLSAGGGSGNDNNHSGGGSDSGSFLSGIIGSLSNSAGGSSGNGVEDPSDYPLAGQENIDVGGYSGPGAGKLRSTTEENIPEFDRTKVSLDVPPQIFGGGFTIITNISKILSSLIMNSAKRTESVLEVFKPIFRGKFAIKGLPSDNQMQQFKKN